MSIKNKLQWTFIPENYFEEEQEYIIDNVNIEVKEGVVNLISYTKKIGSNWQLRNTYEEIVENIFLGAQIINEKPYYLYGPTYKQITENGDEYEVLFAESTELVLFSDRVDIKHYDADGNLVYSSKSQRINERNHRINQAINFIPNDPTARNLFKIYHEAKKDEDRMFFLLYEIVDTLGRTFGNKEKAYKTLKIRKKTWRRFTKQLNDLPVDQSRHKGKHIGVLRSISKDEKEEIFELALYIIKKYLDFIM